MMVACEYDTCAAAVSGATRARMARARVLVMGLSFGYVNHCDRRAPGECVARVAGRGEDARQRALRARVANATPGERLGRIPRKPARRGAACARGGRAPVAVAGTFALRRADRSLRARHALVGDRPD